MGSEMCIRDSSSNVCDGLVIRTLVLSVRKHHSLLRPMNTPAGFTGLVYKRACFDLQATSRILLDMHVFMCALAAEHRCVR